MKITEILAEIEKQLDLLSQEAESIKEKSFGRYLNISKKIERIIEILKEIKNEF
ncbi:MAG: hypothetical protein AB1297_03140 [bacterium]